LNSSAALEIKLKVNSEQNKNRTQITQSWISKEEKQEKKELKSPEDFSVSVKS
jgi:hypothetical protein